MSEATSNGAKVAIVTITSIVAASIIMNNLDGSDTIKLIVSSIIAGAIAFTIATIATSLSNRKRPKIRKPPGEHLLVCLVLMGALTSLMITTPVSASTPAYTLKDNINTTVKNTAQQDIGYLIFTREQHIPEVHTINTFTSHNAQELDRVTWNNQTYTIEITAPGGNKQLVIPGGQYYLSAAGTYQYAALSDPTITGSIVASPKNDLSVTLTVESDVWTPSVNPVQFVLNKPEQRVNVKLSVPKDYPPRNEQLRIRISTNGEDKNITKTLNLPEIRTWKVVTNNLPVEYGIKGGELEDIGHIQVENTGNTNFDLAAEISGAGKEYVKTQSLITLFKNTVSNFDFRLQIPTTQSDGRYNASIRLHGGASDDYKDSLVVVVKDLTAPQLSNLSFSDPYLTHKSRADIEVTDNIGVKNATMKWDNKTVVLKKDQQRYSYEGEWWKPKEYLFKVCAVDIANNTQCQEYNHTFKKLDTINASKNLLFETKKYSTFTSKTLFVLSEKPPEGIKVRLLSFIPSIDLTNRTKRLVGERNSLFTIRVVDGDGSFQYFNDINQTVEVYQAGDIQLEIMADKEALDSKRIVWSGQIAIDEQEYYATIPDISYEGTTVDYALPEGFNIAWGTGGFLSCTVTDTGALETSKGLCELEIPAEDLSKDLVIPISLKEKEYLENEVNRTATALERQVLIRNSISGVFLALLLVFVGVFVFYVRIRPNLMVIRKW